jgi:predicted transcriptional regulator
MTTTTEDLALSPSLRARVEAIAAKSGQSPADIVADALENGHSLEWQERYVDEVLAGLEDARNGNFATPAELNALRNKYRAAS